jgi:hypothetical protein
VPSASMAPPAGAETLNQRLRLLNRKERGFIVERHVQFSLGGPINRGGPRPSDRVSIHRAETEESNVHRR